MDTRSCPVFAFATRPLEKVKTCDFAAPATLLYTSLGRSNVGFVFRVVFFRCGAAQERVGRVEVFRSGSDLESYRRELGFALLKDPTDARQDRSSAKIVRVQNSATGKALTWGQHPRLAGCHDGQSLG